MADIFADLLAQYLGRSTIVQPLLPSFFAPMPPLMASDVTLVLPDEHTATPTEALSSTDETHSLSEQEGTAAQTDLAHRRAASSPAASLLSDSTPVIPFRQLLHVPHVHSVQNEPNQHTEHPRGPASTEIAPMPQPRQIVEVDVEKDEAAEIGSISRDNVQVPSNETVQQAAPQERQQQLFRQSEELVRRNELVGLDDKHALYQLERIIAKDISQVPSSVTSILLPSQPSPQVAEPVRQSSAQIQPQTSTAKALTIGREALVQEEEEQPGKFAEQQTRLERRLTFIEPQIAPLARSLPPVRAALSPRAEPYLQETFSSDPPNVLHTSASPVAPGETPRAVKQLAHAILPTPTRPKRAGERPVEHTPSPAHDEAPLVRSEQLAAQVLPKQETTVSADERESQPIRIHIGRVVVRGATEALHAITKPSAKRTLRPTLSLNEYLKQRERGSR